jgi:hypothetical protein
MFLKNRETDLLFDHDYRIKADAEQLVGLVENLRQIVAESQPSLEEVLKDTLVGGEAGVADLVSKERRKRVKKELREITYEQFGPIVTDKSRKMTRRAFVKTVRNVAFVGGGLWVAGKLLKGANDKLEADNLGGQKDEKNTGHNNYWKAWERAKKRNPDLTSREDVEKSQPFYYGQITNLPEKHYTGTFGEFIGFFPVSRFYDSTGVVTAFKAEEKKETTVVESLSNASIEYGKDQLAVKLDEVASVMYPPLGWKIVRIIQEKGDKPKMGRFGEIYYDEGATPKGIVLVMDKIPPEEWVIITGGITLVGTDQSYNPGFTFDELRAETVNQGLGGDPKLQQLHRELIEKVKLSITGEGQSVSRVALEFTKAFEQYVHQNRYYALGFKVGQESGYSFLRAIADRPEEGYYCQVAARAYKEFMESVGFTVGEQLGFKLNGYNMELWGRLGHANNMVILPNGEVLIVDTTPPPGDKTPQEDYLAVMTQKDPPPGLVEAVINDQSVKGMASIEVNKKFKDAEEAFRYAKKLNTFIRSVCKKNANKGWMAQSMIVVSNMKKDVSRLRYVNSGKRGRPSKRLEVDENIAYRLYKGDYMTDYHLHILLVSKPNYAFRDVVKDYIDKRWFKESNVEENDSLNSNQKKVYKKDCNIKIADYFIAQCEKVLFCDCNFGEEEKLKYSLRNYYNESLKVDSQLRRLYAKHRDNPMTEKKYLEKLDKIESKLAMIKSYYLDITKEQDNLLAKEFMNKVQLGKIRENRNKEQDLYF